MDEKELNEWIRGCAAYLREKPSRDLTLGLTRPTYDDIASAGMRSRAIYDYSSLTLEIRDIQEKINKVNDSIAKIERSFLDGMCDPFFDIENHISRSRHHANMAWVELGLALNRLEGKRPPNTKAMTLQRSAVTFAYACVVNPARGQVREIAKKIITEAGLEMPHEDALSRWIREERGK